MKRVLIALALPVVALVEMTVPVAPREADAQSGTRVVKQAYYDALWSWLQRTNYAKWNGTDGDTPPDFEKGQSPHGALIKTYVSAKAATNLKDLPNGSVIVKENYSTDKKLMAITVMHRSAGLRS